MFAFPKYLYCKLVQCIFVTTFFPKTLCWLVDSGHETCANVGSQVVTSSPLVSGPCLVHMKCGATVTLQQNLSYTHQTYSAASATCPHTINHHSHQFAIVICSYHKCATFDVTLIQLNCNCADSNKCK